MKPEEKKPISGGNQTGGAGSRASAGGAGDNEPSAKVVVSPIWLIFLFGALFYAGQLYVDSYSGGFDPMVYREIDTLASVQDRQPKSEGDLEAAQGKKIFSMYCTPCHQASGMGTPGQFPPLPGSEWVNAPGPNRIGRLLLNGGAGAIQVKGQAYGGGGAQMLPFRSILKDDEIAAVLTYIRQNKEWGNNASKVTPEQVKKIRDATKDRPETKPWSPEELQQIPDKD